MSINKLKKAAEKALQNINNGKSYSIKYVYNRVAIAAEKHPRDILLNTMRDVLEKKASSQNFINQKEISGLYNSLYNYSGSYSEFRSELGDLLTKDFGVAKKSATDASGSRDKNYALNEPLHTYRSDLNKLAQEFSGIFNLDQRGSFSELSSNSSRKAEKFAKLQLKSIGCDPLSVRAIRNNDHFILCLASYPSLKNTEISLKVPVQIKSGQPSLPTHFVENDKLTRLSQENVLVFLKTSEQQNIKNAKSKYSKLRISDEISIDRLDSADNISKWANLEQDILEASTKYNKNTIKLASAILSSELKSFNLVNPQISIKSVFENGVNCRVKFASINNISDIIIPVEIHSGQPIMPLKFSHNKEEYSFSKKGFERLNGRLYENKGSVSLISEYTNDMDYNQLIGLMTSSANHGDFKSAEDALYSIQNKYSGQQVINAISKYSKLLQINSDNKNRQELIANALKRGDLIKTSTSFDLYSPKYGVTLSKLAFDNAGDLIPKYRYKNSNLKESEGFNITTSQIKLT